MASLEVKTEWAVYKDCFLQVARYQADNSRAIEIWNNKDGPIARITVCITGSGLAEDETVIDTNNCPLGDGVYQAARFRAGHRQNGKKRLLHISGSKAGY